MLYSFYEFREGAPLKEFLREMVINSEWRDQAENAMLMDITLGDYTVTLGSIYGPNNTSREFYRFLNQAIAESTGKYKIIGGD